MLVEGATEIDEAPTELSLSACCALSAFNWIRQVILSTYFKECCSIATSKCQFWKVLTVQLIHLLLLHSIKGEY